MSAGLDLFIEAARSVAITEAAESLGLRFQARGAEHAQPCPACGGTDCFAFNTAKNAWNCRAGDAGGRDAIGMAAHVAGLDVKRRDQFLQACSLLTGHPVPDGGERMMESERDRIAADLAARRQANEATSAMRREDANAWREREQHRARGIWQGASTINDDDAAMRYLCARWHQPEPVRHRLRLRYSPAQTYWHGTDEFGRPVDHHTGPAMIAAFIADPDDPPIGCHITWIDLARPPKFRPLLYALTAEGLRAGRPKVADTPRNEMARLRPSAGELDAGYYEMLPAKKMRGTKKGGLIPVAGRWAAERWVVGEGIETAGAAGLAEGFRGDSFYAAAGDLGNMAGAALARGRFRHPTLTRQDKKGAVKPVMVPSPFADPERLADGMPVAAHVRELVLLAERGMDAIIMSAHVARAKERVELLAPPARVVTAWPPADFGDFCDILAGVALGG